MITVHCVDGTVDVTVEEALALRAFGLICFDYNGAHRDRQVHGKQFVLTADVDAFVALLGGSDLRQRRIVRLDAENGALKELAQTLYLRLMWVMENTLGGGRARETFGVVWLDANHDPHETYAASYEEAIDKAMAECAVLDAKEAVEDAAAGATT